MERQSLNQRNINANGKKITAKQFIDEARNWVGTPFQHQGRKKGVGVDCVGLVIGVAHELQMTEDDYNGYSDQAFPKLMQALLDEHGIKVPTSEMRPGDVLFLRYMEPQHLAIFTEKNTIIHADNTTAARQAYGKMGRCIEHILNDRWRRRIIAVYRVPGVEP